MRAVVVGASSGLGRSIGLGLAARGARVAFLARRVDHVTAAAAEAGDGAVGIGCDVTDEASCRAGIDAAAAALGGIDGLVYAAGVGAIGALPDTDAATWTRLLTTNVTGAAITTAAALPHLEASTGVAVYLSSVSASLTPPWPGIGAYAVSKAALDKLVEAWRAEYPRIGFTRAAVGDCIGGDGDAMSQFATDWDLDVAQHYMPIWAQRGYFTGGLIDVAELVAAVDTVLRIGATASIPSITIAPRPPAP